MKEEKEDNLKKQMYEKPEIEYIDFTPMEGYLQGSTCICEPGTCAQYGHDPC